MIRYKVTRHDRTSCIVHGRSKFSNEFSVMKNTDFKNRQQGMTLVEIMIALVLGAFLLGGVMQIFLSSKQFLSPR